MSKRIFPSDLKRPYKLADLERMIDSWRGTIARDVPHEVKVIRWIYEALLEAVDFNEYLRGEVQALEQFIDRIRRKTELWPDEIARDMLRQALHAGHRQAIAAVQERDRREAKQLASELVALSDEQNRDCCPGDGNVDASGGREPSTTEPSGAVPPSS